MNGGTANYPADTTAHSSYPPSSQKAYTTGTANRYPPTQSGYGAANGPEANSHGHYSHHNMNEKAGFVNNNSGYGYGHGNAYVQEAPVAYGSDAIVARKNRRFRNAIVGTLAVCCCCIAL